MASVKLTFKEVFGETREQHMERIDRRISPLPRKKIKIETTPHPFWKNRYGR